MHTHAELFKENDGHGAQDHLRSQKLYVCAESMAGNGARKTLSQGSVNFRLLLLGFKNHWVGQFDLHRK